MDMPPADPSPAHFGPEPEPLSTPRAVAARPVRATGLLFGAALTAIDLLIAWVAPPDMSNANLRSVLNFYLTGPLLLFIGPIFLAAWLAARIEGRKPSD